MQRKIRPVRRSELEDIKDAGLVLDFDEIARKGAMSAEEKQIAKWYGVYGSRQKGDHMIRVVIPGGDLTAAQARALGQMADKYSPGILSFTTRQSAQFHRVQVAAIPHLLRDLQAAGLTSWHGCGDVGRNVAACPWASICPHRRLDVLPYAKLTSERLGTSADLNNLPRKFKVTYSGCGGLCGQPYINCVGNIGILRRRPDGSEEAGFRVVLGGGMGWAPFVAQELYSFVPADRIVELAHAAGVLFRDHGDRFNRATARLKFVVHRQGIDRCREILEQNLRAAGVDLSGFETAPVEDIAPPVPDRPLRETDPRGTDGGAIQRIMIAKGELKGSELVRIAELSEMYADKHVYSTNRQNLELHGVDPKRVGELRRELGAIGFRTEGFYGLADMVACVGTTYCPLAVSETRRMFDLLEPVVTSERYAPIRDRVLINITGCPNACSPYYIADIGLRGLRIRRRDGEGSDEGYQVRIGGTQQKFGQVLGEFKTEDCVPVIEAVLERFLQVGGHSPNPGPETLAECVDRLGTAPFVQAVETLGIRYQVAPNPTEYSVRAGEGHAVLDRMTIAKDVPCQEACPAKTNVPEYIRLIALGDFEGAFRVNQEDNVFPGVLGRTCTRPCEPACRHTWTNIQGPVRICHLKRSAADGKEHTPRPLAPWFGPTGKRVAVVGGGPAGLTAARELKRFGHEVVLFEREAYLGGMMRYGIPRFRLPREVLEEEIAAIVDSGIDVRLDHEVQVPQLVEMLDGQEYDAVLVTAGACVPRALELPGLAAGAGIEGLNLLRRFNTDQPVTLADPVVIIGGGFTAVDCARSARRLLGPDSRVTIAYRRGQEQMAASGEELHELLREGIRIELLVTPVSARMAGERLAGVTFRRNVLGPPETEGGKPRMLPVEGSDFELPVGSLIFAIGQSQTTGVLPPEIQHTGRHTTSHRKLLIAGDFALGSEAIIDAVADGKSAANLVDARLMGKARRHVSLQVQPAEDTGRIRDYDLLTPPPMPVLPLDRRWGHEEVETGYGPEQTQPNALRCYLCSYKYEIDQDLCIHCDWCIKVSPRRCILRLSHLELDEHGAPVSWREVNETAPTEARETTYIWIDSDECIRCGNCIRACPVHAISLRKADLATTGGPSPGRSSKA